jgi:DNA-binding transcriptional ArsR family regulator
MTDEAPAGRRELELSTLRALAHPLRVRIMQELTNFGPLTASGLAERLGESSGATSYHLRQLAKHDIIREVEGKGSARERWWQLTPGDLRIGSATSRETPAGREATDIISREWHAENERQLTAFLRYGRDILGSGWEVAATLSTGTLRLTREHLQQFGDEYLQFLSSMEEKYASDEDTGAPEALQIQVQFNAFPLVDLLSPRPTETPKDPS